MYEQIQRSLTFRGADAITDHSAEKVDIAEKILVAIFSRTLPLCLITTFYKMRSGFPEIGYQYTLRPSADMADERNLRPSGASRTSQLVSTSAEFNPTSFQDFLSGRLLEVPLTSS